MMVYSRFFLITGHHLYTKAKTRNGDLIEQRT